MNMKASENIKNKIKEFEGLRLKAYKCSAGVWTIGYGHTAGVKEGDTITKICADEFFDQDIVKFEKGVTELIQGAKKELRQVQFDALVSFAFNLGLAALSRSSLLKRVRRNPDDPAIRIEFNKWVNARGKKLAGLVKRREVEADHYFGKI